MNFIKYAVCLCSIAIIVSCGTQQQGEEHSHDDITVPYTGYSDEVEVFVDVEPLAVAVNSQLIIHFTDLKSFQPIKAKELEVALIVGQKGLKVKSREPVQDGIFKVIIQPQTAGIGRLDFTLHTDSKIYMVSIPIVEVYKNQHDAVHLAEAKIPSSANGISFTKEQAWKVDFKTQVPDVKKFGDVIKAGAKVSFSPVNQQIISAKISGFVQFSNRIISDGQSVMENEWLMTVSGKGLTENNATVRLQKAKVEYDIAKADYLRDKRLNGKQIVSDKKLLESKARFDIAKTNLNSLQQTVSLSGEKVRVKSSGYIRQVFVRNGEYVEEGDPLFSIVQSQKILLKAMVRPRHLRHLNSLYDASIELNDGSVVSLTDVNGRIVSVGRSVDNDSYLLPVSMELDYNQNLTTGGFANVYLKTISAQDEIVVPKTALIEIQGMYFVYIQLTPELFERRQVHLGATDGAAFVVTSGLKPNERIVTRGATFVKLAAVSNSVDPHAGHVH